VPNESALPRVDVVVCTLQRPELLARALRSVWAQDYAGQVDVLVVVDGPGDLPGDLPAPTEGRSLRVERNGGRPGLAGGRNYGLSRSTATLLATIDDDDEWRPGRLSAQVGLLAADPTLVGVGGSTCIVQAGGRVTRTTPLARIGHDDLLADRIAPLHPSTFLLDTARVRAVGGWDEDLPGGYAEDYDFLLRLTRDGDIAMVEDVVADIHWAGQSYFFSRWAQIAEAMTHLLAKHPDLATSAAGHARVLGQIAFARAASGDRRGAWQVIRTGLRVSPREPRFVLAALVASRLVTADRVQQALHARGRGI
jgi:glycosyltransferase involved in cell wall biosynthesis